MTDVKFANFENSDVPRTLICACGYEARSSHFLRTAGDDFAKVLVYDYGSGGLHSYDENNSFYGKIGLLCQRLDDVITGLRSELENGPRIVVLDVTSFDREKLGRLLKWLYECRSKLVGVEFVYCPSEYRDPQFRLGIVNTFGPVLPTFAGDISETRRKLALLVGVGYEFGRTVGAIEALEPDKIYGFRPVGTDPRFEKKIEENNLGFDFMSSGDSLKEYDLNTPRQLYILLRKTVELELSKRSVLILPMGPKIFAAMSLLIAMIRHPAVMVWRHSTTTSTHPESTTDAFASGQVVKFAFIFD